MKGQCSPLRCWMHSWLPRGIFQVLQLIITARWHKHTVLFPIAAVTAQVLAYPEVPAPPPPHGVLPYGMIEVKCSHLVPKKIRCTPVILHESYTCASFVDVCAECSQCQFTQHVHDRVGCLSWGNATLMHTQTQFHLRCRHKYTVRCVPILLWLCQGQSQAGKNMWPLLCM